MKIKVFILTFIFALSSITLFSRKGEGGDGGLAVSTLRMSVPPVTIELLDNSAVVYYNIDLGNVTTTLKNNLGADVYKKVVNTTYDYSLSINTANLPSGKYTFIFTDAQGNNIQNEVIVID